MSHIEAHYSVGSKHLQKEINASIADTKEQWCNCRSQEEPFISAVVQENI